MPRLDQATRNGTPYYNIMDHRSDISRKWKEVDQLLRFNGRLDAQLKEEVRRAVSQYSGCRFCASLGDPKPDHDDARVAAAVGFATAVAQNPHSVSDEAFDPLREHFSAEEIVELSCWISFMYGAELFGAIMNLDPATESQKTAYAAWLKQGTRLALANRA
jgi:alkylhydroperoxidase family enzyme